MPTYDYKCPSCQHVEEMQHGMKDVVNTVCPQCRHDFLVKVISSGTPVHFKGSGFYETDYKGK